MIGTPFDFGDTTIVAGGLGRNLILRKVTRKPSPAKNLILRVGSRRGGGGGGGGLLILGRGYPHLLQHLLSVFCVMPGLRAAERGLQTRFPALAAMTHEAFSHAIAQCGAQPHMVPIIGGMPMSSVPRTKVP